MRRLLLVFVVLVVAAASVPPLVGAASDGGSIRFHGFGADDADRVKIQIDDPATALPGPPADVGATDFTIEFWLRARPGTNTAASVQCGENIAWIFGNIVLDRDRFNQGRKFGLSLAGGRAVFGVSGESGATTICGTTDVRDGEWHHIAVQRRRSDGRLSLYVDGVREARADGPDGDVSYPDDGVPGDFCGGPCTWSDPYLVIGAEKHDAGSAFPSFDGWIDELRISTVERYTTRFTPRSVPFVPDGTTAALYHFDEESGLRVTDEIGRSHGVRSVGGDPPGPQWRSVSPFDGTPMLTCFGVPATIVGTGGDDHLVGTPGPDVIVGRGGADVIEGRSGRDLLCGGRGRDLLFGNGGADRISGDRGFDVARGGKGRDRCVAEQRFGCRRAG